VRLNKIAKISIGIGVAIAVLAGSAWLLAPRMLEGYAKRTIIEQLARRDLHVSIDSLRLATSSARLEGVCLQGLPPNEQHAVLCVDTLTVTFTREGGWLGRDITPTDVDVYGGFVDLRNERGTLRELVQTYTDYVEEQTTRRRERREARASDQASEVRERTDDPLELTLRSFEIRLDDQGLPADRVMVDRLGITLVGGEVSLDSHVGFIGLHVDSAFPIDLPDGLTLNAHVQSSESASISIRPDTALRVRGPGPHGDFALSLGGVGFSMPYFLSVESVEVDIPGQPEPLIGFPTATLELRALVRDPADLYMTALDVSSPHVFLRVNEHFRPQFMDDLYGPRREAAEEDVVETTDGDAPGSDDTGSDAGESDAGESDEQDGVDDADDVETTQETPVEEEASSASNPWGDRAWWEQIPQMIRIHNGTLTLASTLPERGQMTLRNASIVYALRIFHFQMDATLEGELLHDDEVIGEINLTATWGWTRGNLGFTLGLRDIDAGSVARFLGQDGRIASGKLDLAMRFQQAPRGPGMTTSGEITLRSWLVHVPGFGGPVAVDRFSYAWTAERDPNEEPIALRVTEGQGTLGDATFEFTPTLYDFRLDRPQDISRIDIVFELPDQPAQTLFDAVPAPLFSDLSGTVLEGNYGLSAEFALEFSRDDEGTSEMRFADRPLRVTHRDSTVRLIDLPQHVDVRRLNQSFTFTFRGPNDAINRTIHVPSPHANADDARATSWASLSQISWYLIAIQLYREDGRFFENRGINWYQMRRAIQEAWAAGRLGRGASTISMQLVKNVFLSHDRNLERKVQEIFLTYWMTRLVPKERILEVYLNVIEWGPGINGVVEAADYYFGRAPADLTAPEAAWLSAITPDPARRSAQRSQGEPPAWMVRRCRSLVSGIASRGMITRSELRKAEDQEILFVTSSRYGQPRPRSAPIDLEPVAGSDAEADFEPAPQEEPEDRSGLLAYPPEDRVQRLIANSLRPRN